MLLKLVFAARRRDLDRVEHARLRRVLEIRHVGVPHRFARAEAADRNTVLDHVRDDVDFRMPVDEASPVLLDRREVQLAEPAAERDQVIVAQRLSAEQQHQMIQPGAMDRGKFAVVDATQIDPANLRAKRGTRRCHCDRHAALSSSISGQRVFDGHHYTRSSTHTGTWSDPCGQSRASFSTICRFSLPTRSGVTQTWSSRRPRSDARQSRLRYDHHV